MVLPVWLLIALPLLGAIVLLLAGKATNAWGHLLSCAAVLASFAVGVVFLAAFAHGLEQDPVAALRRTLDAVKAAMQDAGIQDPLRFTATLTDGETLWAFRWSCDARPPSLYYKQDTTGLRLVSEPIDGQKAGWNELPRGATLIARRGQLAEIDLTPELAQAA